MTELEEAELLLHNLLLLRQYGDDYLVSPCGTWEELNVRIEGFLRRAEPESPYYGTFYDVVDTGWEERVRSGALRTVVVAETCSTCGHEIESGLTFCRFGRWTSAPCPCGDHTQEGS